MTIGAALSLLIALIQNAQSISQIIMGAIAQGRSTLTDNEWNTILRNDDAARAALAAALGAPAAPPPDPQNAPQDAITPPGEAPGQ